MARASQYKVLVADDELVCREAARFLIEHFGVTCNCVSDGSEVLHAIQKDNYDIALLDLQMNAVSGIEAARHIRAREGAYGLSRMPIVAMTGREEDLEECLVAGFDEIILKPMRLSDVGTMFEQFLPKVSLANLQFAAAH